MKPNILNPAWKYVPSGSTNLKATFARVRRELEKKEKPVASNVRQIVVANR